MGSAIHGQLVLGGRRKVTGNKPVSSVPTCFLHLLMFEFLPSFASVTDPDLEMSAKINLRVLSQKQRSKLQHYFSKGLELDSQPPH